MSHNCIVLVCCYISSDGNGGKWEALRKKKGSPLKKARLILRLRVKNASGRRLALLLLLGGGEGAPNYITPKLSTAALDYGGLWR